MNISLDGKLSIDSILTPILGVYRSMLTSKLVDEACQRAVDSQIAAFHCSTRGHELSAILAPLLTRHDWLHPHYRNKALLIGRGITIRSFFDMLFYSVDSNSLGRRLPVMCHHRESNLLSGSTPVGNNALQSVGVAAGLRDLKSGSTPIVICGMGDGSTQQGEVLESILESASQHLPVLFWIDDNELAISTSTTGKTFLDRCGHEFLSVPVTEISSSEVIGSYEKLQELTHAMRENRKPQIVRAQVTRIGGHSNADNESTYRPNPNVIDPVQVLYNQLIENGVQEVTLQTMQNEIDTDIQIQFEEAAQKRDLVPPLGTAKRSFFIENSKTVDKLPKEIRTIREALNCSLRQSLVNDAALVVLGQDIEDPKGDVFGITRGLSTEFPQRVINSPLSESTIVGTCIGRALAGQKPVAFIQFADFIPLALNQILNELSTMFWRTNGDWQVPVTIIAAAGGYRAGTGPFHSATYDSLLCQAPGLDVLYPSRPETMYAAWQHSRRSNRPTIILYPKALLNDTSRSLDIHPKCCEPIRVTSGSDLTIVTWGSCSVLVEQAVQAVLTQTDVSIDQFELTSLSPLEIQPIVSSAQTTGRLLVVHEDFETCGIGAEVISRVAEETKHSVVQFSRLCRTSFVPCHEISHTHALPSFTDIIEQVGEMTGHEIQWISDHSSDSNDLVIARGASPSDHEILIVQWKVRPGEEVAEGQIIAELEAEKSTFDFAAPRSGKVLELLYPVDSYVSVGSPVMRLESGNVGKQTTEKDSNLTFMFNPSRKQNMSTAETDPALDTISISNTKTAWMGRPNTVIGSGTLHNDELKDKAAKWTDAQIFKRVGIRSRPIVRGEENVVSMATAAAEQALASHNLKLTELQSVICSTTTATRSTPSVASDVVKNLVLNAEETKKSFMPSTLDINAACSGFVYGLQLAFDQLHQDDRPVLLLTSEVISPLIDYEDPSTAYVFGDAATATIVYAGKDRASTECLPFIRPILATVPDLENSLQADEHEKIERKLFMDGVDVARAAKKAMAGLSEELCEQVSCDVDKIAFVIPHQANQRILDGVAWNLDIPKDKLLSTLETTGNTSSSSIPLCLQRNWDEVSKSNKPSLLTAFGAGFTVASTLVLPFAD